MSTRTKVIVASVIVAALVGLVILDLASSPRRRGKTTAAAGDNDRTPPRKPDIRLTDAPPPTPVTPTPLTPTDAPTRVVIRTRDVPPAPVVSTGPATPSTTTTAPANTAPPLVTPRQPEPGASPEVRRYEVQAGDSLWEIAQKVYGDGSLFRIIQEANPNVRPMALTPGMMLTIPPRPQHERSFSELAPTPADGRTYTIQSGDTLEGIALRFYQNRALAMAIFEANRDVLSDPNMLAVGRTIRLPASLAAAQAQPAVGTSRAGVLPAGAKVYRIQPGDSLWKIASRNAGDRSVPSYIAAIVEQNRDRLPNGADTILQPGWELVLP